MTEAQARTTANVVLATAAIGAAYYILKTPPLRRTVWRLARSWAAGPLAAWTATEVRRAWDGSASGRTRVAAEYGATTATPDLSPTPDRQGITVASAPHRTSPLPTARTQQA
jgi:H+/gluconate symporter-like permease